MKYVIIIPDGAADPISNENAANSPGTSSKARTKTALEEAKTPNIDRIIRAGLIGRTDNVPPSLQPASDVATLSLFGYDPLKYYTGRAPLEAVAMGVKLGPFDWAIRCNLVYLHDSKMADFTSGHISSEDGGKLIRSMQEHFGGEISKGKLECKNRYEGVLEFVPGVQYRNLLIYRSQSETAPFSADTRTQPPHDIPDQLVTPHLPQGPGSDLLQDLMKHSQDLFATHPVNTARKMRGDKPATQVWLWGLGKSAQVEPFAERYKGTRGAIISAVDLVRGTGMLIGWQRIDSPGATGYLDTNYVNKGLTAIEALKSHDLVCVHIEAPDEASHEGSRHEKIRAIQEIDSHIVGPIYEALKTFGEFRIMICPDHCTSLATRAHSRGMVPFACAGSYLPTRLVADCEHYDEYNALKSPICFPHGYQMMEWFLGKSPSN